MRATNCMQAFFLSKYGVEGMRTLIVLMEEGGWVIDGGRVRCGEEFCCGSRDCILDAEFGNLCREWATPSCILSRALLLQWFHVTSMLSDYFLLSSNLAR